MFGKILFVLKFLWEARGLVVAIVEAVETLGDPRVKARIRVHATAAGVEKILNRVVKEVTSDEE